MSIPARVNLDATDLPLTAGSPPATIDIATVNQWVKFASNVFNARFKIDKGSARFTYLPTGDTMVPEEVSKFDNFPGASPFQNSSASDLYIWAVDDAALIEVEV